MPAASSSDDLPIESAELDTWWISAGSDRLSPSGQKLCIDRPGTNDHSLHLRMLLTQKAQATNQSRIGIMPTSNCVASHHSSLPSNHSLSVDMSTSCFSISPSTTDPEATVTISLITVTGERHGVRIEAKHLAYHKIGNVDLIDIPAQSLKAFLRGRWQRAWGLQPPDPSRIKLAHFGHRWLHALKMYLSHFRQSNQALANHSRHYR